MTEIALSPEQAMLGGIAERFFRERWSLESTREQIETDSGYDAELWAEMVDVGWVGMTVPEEHDGTGLGLMELVTLVEPMGRCLFSSPFVPTQLAIQALLHGGSEEQQAEWLAKLAGGAVGTVATTEADGAWDLDSPACLAEATDGGFRITGEKHFVVDAGVANLVVASVSLDGDPALALLPGDRVREGTVERQIVVDETRRSYRVVLDLEIGADALVTGARAADALEAVEHTALLLLSAEACGGTAGALDVVLEYLKTRRQFDRLIGSYQALKHPTVDILVGLERSRSHVYHAATVAGGDSAEVALRMAKASASDAFAFAGDRAIQFHGGFGFTYECDAQLYLRRALWTQYQFGDAPYHRQRLAEALL